MHTQEHLLEHPASVVLPLYTHDSAVTEYDVRQQDRTIQHQVIEMAVYNRLVSVRQRSLQAGRRDTDVIIESSFKRR